MSFAAIMVCLRAGESNAAVLAVARDVALRFGSAAIGCAARQVSTRAAPIRGAGPCEPRQYALRRFAEQSAAAEEEFRHALAGVEKLEWRAQMTFGPAHEHIASEARSADLLIAPIDCRDGIFSMSGQAELYDLLRSVGRPVLAAPAQATGLAFEHALVSWKETRESRRAVADALPFLKAMRRVDVIEFVEAEAIEASGRRLGDVGAWLMRHGVPAECRTELARGSKLERIGALAQDLRTDIIVSGAFSHGRMHDWAFGGDTRNLIARSRRCILASH